MSVLALVICEKCEKVFMGGPLAFFCPECRKALLSKAAKERDLCRSRFRKKDDKGDSEHAGSS